jgi:hypothetical protein
MTHFKDTKNWTGYWRDRVRSVDLMHLVSRPRTLQVFSIRK